MESNYCSHCYRTLPLSYFVPDTKNNDKVFLTCINCRAQSKQYYKEKITEKRTETPIIETCASEIVRTMGLRNESLAYTQQNSMGGGDSLDGGLGEENNGTTRAQRPAANANDRSDANRRSNTNGRSNANVPSFPPDTTDRIPSCLEEEFPRYATATENFPPEISKENLRRCYNEYQERIDWCADRSPCGICGGSFQSDSVHFYSQERLLELENVHELDCCAVREDGAYICHACGHGLELKGRKSVPKFSGANWVNKSLCQHRPTVFDELTLIERQVIARCHLVGYVVRLSRDTKAEISYSGSRGHIVAFKQDPSELLSILPSPDLRLSIEVPVHLTEYSPVLRMISYTSILSLNVT
jgi:hypothetical protein